MPALNLFARPFFFLTAFIGFYLTFILALQNGIVSYIDHYKSLGLLPGTAHPLKRSYTGIAPLDSQLSSLTIFFWPLAEVHLPALTISWLNFGGQLASAWTLITLEGMRAGHKGRLISNVAIIGLLIQNLSYAATLAVLWATHPTITSKSKNARSFAFIAPNSVEASIVPLSIFLTFVLPSILWALPAPTFLSYEWKQIIMVIWHAFPLSTSLLQKGITNYFGTNPQFDNTINQIWSLRRVYAFALLVASIPRIIGLTLSFATILSPALFIKDYIGAMGPKRVFLPVNPMLATSRANSLAEALLSLLQYDEAIGGWTTLIWALLSVDQLVKNNRTSRYLTFLSLAIPVLSFLLGPIGCAVTLLWTRDEIAFESSSISKREHRQ